MKKAVGWIIVLVALLGAGFVYWYLALRTPAPQVAVTVAKPSRVLLGEPFALTASYRNDSEQALRNAKIIIVLPAGVSALGQPADRRVIEKSQGDLGPGPGNLGTFRFVATENPRSLAQFEVRLRYSVTDDSGSQIETKTVVDVAVGEPAAALNLAAPEEVVSGEPFTITAQYRNDSREALLNAKLVADHPAGFQLRSSEPAASGKEWALGTLSPGAAGTVVVTGVIRPGEAEAPVAFALEAEFEGSSYPIARQTATVRAKASYLSLDITANRKSDYVASPGDRITYELRYRNNAEVALENIELKASLSGTLFDYRSLEPGGGAFNSVANSISWTSATTPQLALLAPGAEGVISFSATVQRDITLKRLGDKHFSLKVRGDIVSPTVPAGVASSATTATASLETKIAGRTDLAALALYYESAASGIKNTGPFPFRVNKATQVTVHWKLKNYWNDISNVRVVAKLASGVRFTGAVKSTTGDAPVYDAATGEVSWEVPKIAATVGVLSAAPEAVFQIEVTPAVNQVGSVLTLVGESIVTAKDDFTGLTLRAQAGSKTSDLRDDPRASALGSGGVQP